jgi:hypothetical protein
VNKTHKGNIYIIDEYMYIQEGLCIKDKVTVLLHSAPVELLILLYQCLRGMRRVCLRSLFVMLVSVVMPVDTLPLSYSTCFCAAVSCV